MRRSPVMSIRPVPVVRGGRYLQGPGHATKPAGPGVGHSRSSACCVDRAVSHAGAALLAPADGVGGVAWSAVLLVQQAVIIGVRAAAAAAWHAVLIEYLPFVTLLLALYTAGGGVLLRGGPGGTPAAIPRCWRWGWRWAW